jgi:phosphatidylglycerol---prolipoprotein diacylglyceryl transferase
MHPLITIGPLTLSTYWLLTLTGMALVIPGTQWQGRHLGVARGERAAIAMISLIAGYVGAMSLWAWLNAAWLQSHWWHSTIQHMGHTGLVLYGWTLGAFGTGALYVWWRKLPFGALADLYCPWIAFAQVWNRLGCFSVGCCYGTPTTLPWGWSLPHLTTAVHPTQLYEAGFDAVLFTWLVWFAARKGFAGQVALLYFMCYATWRFSIEFIRGDQHAVFGPLTLSQAISLAVLVVASAIYAYARNDRHIKIEPVLFNKRTGSLIPETSDVG